MLDAPGGFDFAGEVMEALTVADAAIIVCSAKAGISVGLEKAWKYCEERDMPRFIYISKTCLLYTSIMKGTTIRSRLNPKLEVSVIAGHFATRHSHRCV